MSKKNLILPIAFVFTVINSIPVLADDIISEWLRFLFIDLSDLAEGGDQIFVIFFKLFLFFLIFAVLFWAGEKVFHDKNRIAGAVAFIIALMSVILLPGDYVLLIFQTYSAVIGYVFILLPVIIGAVLATKLANEMKGHEHIKRIIKGLVFLLIAILTFSLSTTIISEGSDAYFEVAKWAKFGGFICLFIGIYYLITFGKEEKPEAPKAS